MSVFLLKFVHTFSFIKQLMCHVSTLFSFAMYSSLFYFFCLLMLFLFGCIQLSSKEESFRMERLYVNKLNIILVQVWPH